jgi:hypothetical protein
MPRLVDLDDVWVEGLRPLPGPYEDLSRAQDLVARLRAKGRGAWLDTTGAIGGEDWIEQVVATIGRSSALVLVITRHAMASLNVRREVQYADAHGVAVIPVAFEDVDFLAWYAFLFGSVHRIDGSGEEGAQRAAQAIVTVLGER